MLLLGIDPKESISYYSDPRTPTSMAAQMSAVEQARPTQKTRVLC